MLQVLEDHYRPSSISNTFTTLLSLFNDKQGDAEVIHEFRSCFEGNLLILSHSSVAIPQILQVMLFLRAIHPRYEGLINQFASKQKDLSTTSIDLIMSDVKYMDGFIPVDANGKPVLPPSTPRLPTAATVVTDHDGKEHRSPWEWLATFDTKGITARWHRSMQGGFYCAICHSKDKHLPTKCPLLTELGLKLIDVGGGSAGGPKPPAGTTPTGGTAGIPGAKAAAAGFPAPPTDDSSAAPAGMTASLVADEDEDSTDSFRWDGDKDGVTFDEAVKPKASVSSYLPSTPNPSCCRVSFEAGPTCSVTQLANDIILPPLLVRLLLKAIPTTNSGSRFVVADTGATDHMVPDRGAFISYKSIHGLRVHMGNNSFAPVLGWGTAIISLNGQRLLIRNVLHVPGLRVLLYSLRAHLCQSGCIFLGSYETGMQVYFPGVVLTVDTSSDCHLSYESLGKSALLSSLHYVQPRCLPVVYPTERSALLARTRAQSRRDHLLTFSSTELPEDKPTPSLPVSAPSSIQLPHFAGDSLPPSVSPTLLPTLTRDDITRLVHHEGSFLPPVCPCNRANGSDTKTHWTSEELHHALGCCRFRNYKHILQTSLDGQWIDGGDFPLALGSYATIPKAKRGGAIDRADSRFLDMVHMDIAFGSSSSTGPPATIGYMV